MAKAYTLDLRQRIAKAKGSYSHIAKTFQVGKTTVCKYKNQLLK